MTIIEADLRSVEHLDFDVMCNSSPDCEAVAVWDAVVPCCGKHYFACDTCLIVARNNFLDGYYHESCGRCPWDVVASRLPRGAAT